MPFIFLHRCIGIVSVATEILNFFFLCFQFRRIVFLETVTVINMGYPYFSGDSTEITFPSSQMDGDPAMLQPMYEDNVLVMFIRNV